MLILMENQHISCYRLCTILGYESLNICCCFELSHGALHVMKQSFVDVVSSSTWSYTRIFYIWERETVVWEVLSCQDYFYHDG